MKNPHILIFTFLISIFSCQQSPNSPSPSESPYKRAESFIDNLNDQVGCCFRTVKINTYQGEGWVVLRNQEGWYRAINLDDFDKDLESEWDFFQSNQVKVVPSNRYHGSFSDIYGNIYEEHSSNSKDLEKQGHFIEKINIHHMAKKISENYGLSEKRSFEISKSLYQWEKIRTKRLINNKDLDRLSQNLIGLTYKGLKKGLKNIENGQFDEAEDFIEKASKKNGIDPEGLKVLLKDFILN